MAAQLSARAVDIVAHFAAAGNGNMPAFQLLHKALDGRLVRALCHEIDHLDGKMYVDIEDHEIVEEEDEEEQE